MKKITYILIVALMFVFFNANSQNARIQIIHNSADAALSSVDIYVNDMLAVPDFDFRTATEFIDIPAGVMLDIALAPAGSQSSAEAVATFYPTFTEDETYIIVANGIYSTEGYNPPIPFDLHVYPLGQEEANNPENTDVLVFHGSTDAPTVSVYESAVVETTIINDFEYADFAGYLELPTTDYVLEVQDENGEVTFFSYDAPLETLSLHGEAIVVVASGFLNPEANSEGEFFGLYVALPSGGELIPLPHSTARAQIIHNSADLVAEFVDVYVNDILAIEDFEFRTATPFIDLPAGVELDIAIAPAESQSSAEAVANFYPTLSSNGTYVIIANGIVSAEGYSPNIPFDLHVFPWGQEEALSAENTDVLVFHGSTDAPTVSVYESAVVETTIINDFEYADFAGYLELPTLDYVLEIQNAEGTETLFSYDAPLASLELDAHAIVVVASGFVAPENNSDGEEFGLWVALASGGEMIPLPLTGTTGIEYVLYDNNTDLVSVYPNPAIDYLNIDIDDSSSPVNISIYNSIGQIVLQQSASRGSDNVQINVSDLNSGLYIITVEHNGELTTKRVQIVK